MHCAGGWAVKLNGDTSVYLYHNNSLKLQTTASGATVTGGLCGTTSVNSPIVCATSAATIGSSGNTQTTLTVRATNTAGAPGWATAICMEGYVGRGIGTFFCDVSYAGKQWFSGMNYSGGFNTWNVGYTASGGQAEYSANTLFRVCKDGIITSHGTHYVCTCVQSPIVCATADVKIGQTLRFTQNTPYLCTGGAYIVVPSGIYVSGGTLYTENTIMSRNGIKDDTNTYLDIFGGNDSDNCTRMCGKTFVCKCLQSPIVCATTCVKTANLCLNASGGSTLECALVFDATANGNMSSTFRMGTSWDGTVNTIFLGDSNSRTLNISDQDRVGIGHTSPLGLLHLRHTNNNCVPALITSHNLSLIHI